MTFNQRVNYLTAMQIDTWVPRIPLPYAKLPIVVPDEKCTIQTATLTKQQDEPPQNTLDKKATPDTLLPTTIQSVDSESKQVLETSKNNPYFSLQLMQAGPCLLLIELPTGVAFQIRDPAYQLLRNILRAARLPDSPQSLGDIIHWPLFKQTAIPQGEKEAQEFLQSFICTYKEQVNDIRCIWLIGISSIMYTISLTEQNYFQSPINGILGQTLISPSLTMLMDEPNLKSSLWQSIRKLIPLWQK